MENRLRRQAGCRIRMDAAVDIVSRRDRRNDRIIRTIVRTAAMMTLSPRRHRFRDCSNAASAIARTGNA